MASILTGLAEKAKSLWDGGNLLERSTKVYDASRNKITIARMEIDGIEEATISARTISVAEFGIDPSYYTYYDKEEMMTLTLNILPTAKSNSILQALARKQQELKGWFYISVYENGDIVDIFRSHIISMPEITLSMQAPNKVYVFGVKSTLTTNVFASDSTAQTATGSKQSESNAQLESKGVSENTPVQTTPYQPEKGDPNF